MKKIFIFLFAFLLTAIPCFAYSEKNTISGVYADGKIIKMIDGSIYEIFDYDTITSDLWLPMTDVVITGDRIINIDDDESVDYIRQIR